MLRTALRACISSNTTRLFWVCPMAGLWHSVPTQIFVINNFFLCWHTDKQAEKKHFWHVFQPGLRNDHFFCQMQIYKLASGQARCAHNKISDRRCARRDTETVTCALGWLHVTGFAGDLLCKEVCPFGCKTFDLGRFPPVASRVGDTSPGVNGALWRLCWLHLVAKMPLLHANENLFRKAGGLTG